MLFQVCTFSNSPFGQNCFQYEGNDLSNQSLQSYRFSAKKKKTRIDSFITMISSLKTSAVWRTPIEIQMSAKMERNKQTKGWEIINQEICCKAIWVSLFQRQLLGLRSAAVESSTAYSSFKKKKDFLVWGNCWSYASSFPRCWQLQSLHSHLPS